MTLTKYFFTFADTNRICDLGQSCNLLLPDGSYIHEDSYDGFGHIGPVNAFESVVIWNKDDLLPIIAKLEEVTRHEMSLPDYARSMSVAGLECVLTACSIGKIYIISGAEAAEKAAAVADIDAISKIVCRNSNSRLSDRHMSRITKMSAGIKIFQGSWMRELGIAITSCNLTNDMLKHPIVITSDDIAHNSGYRSITVALPYFVNNS